MSGFFYVLVLQIGLSFGTFDKKTGYVNAI